MMGERAKEQMGWRELSRKGLAGAQNEQRETGVRRDERRPLLRAPVRDVDHFRSHKVFTCSHIHFPNVEWEGNGYWPGMSMMP